MPLTLPLREHSQRHLLSSEVHARPYMRLVAPESASHIALYTGEDGAEDEWDIVAAFCRDHDAPQPPPDAKFHLVQLDGFRLRWERHTEFSTYGFFAPRSLEESHFRPPAISRVPSNWLERLPGQVLTALHLELEPAQEGLADPENVAALLEVDTFAGSLAAGGAAEVWMNFTINDDGFGRALVRDRNLGRRQAGRLVQRLFEIETYRMMALLSLPLARDYGADVTRIGSQLGDITQAMAEHAERGGVDNERQLLDRLTTIASETERSAAATAYRFGASRAYYALVERRIAELRESRIEGQQTIGEFMDRRLSPAMRTCQAVADRLGGLSQQVARTSELLRTRVNVQLEAQNRDLLDSMDRRARLQLSLQETVEGLSVAAITYYAIGLVAYAAKAAKNLGLPISAEITPGLAIPVVAGAVWFGTKRLRRRLAERAKA